MSFLPSPSTRAGIAHLPPRLTDCSGDTVHLECVDASGAQVHPDMSIAEYLDIDRDTHPCPYRPHFRGGRSAR